MCEDEKVDDIADVDPIKRDSIINRSKVEWPNHTGKYPILYNCNIYHGCAHNCKYCYAALLTKHWTPNFQWARAKYVSNAVELAQKDIEQPPGRIMFCSMCDPYQPMEAKLRLAGKVLEVLLPSHHYILILTKSDLVERDFGLIENYDNVEVGWTITSLRDLPEWEPNAPGNTRRIEALRQAHDRSIRTFLSVEPWIPGVSDPIAIVEALKDVANRFIFGALNYVRADKSVYKQDVPKLVALCKSYGINYVLKKELKPYA